MTMLLYGISIFRRRFVGRCLKALAEILWVGEAAEVCYLRDRLVGFAQHLGSLAYASLTQKLHRRGAQEVLDLAMQSGSTDGSGRGHVVDGGIRIADVLLYICHHAPHEFLVFGGSPTPTLPIGEGVGITGDGWGGVWIGSGENAAGVH